MDRSFAALAGDFARIDKGAVATYLKGARGRLRELGSERAFIDCRARLGGWQVPKSSSGRMLSVRRLIVFARRGLGPAAKVRL